MWERKLVTKKISNEHHVAIRCGGKTISWIVEEVFLWGRKSGLLTFKRWEAIMLTVITEASDCSVSTLALRIYQAVRASCVEVLKPQDSGITPLGMSTTGCSLGLLVWVCV
jgi:hypothetical protein